MKAKAQAKSKKNLSRKPLAKGKSYVKHHYSGNESKEFWNIVNSIENEADKQELYSLGVALQNMEEYVLRQLRNVKKSYVRGRKYL